MAERLMPNKCSGVRAQIEGKTYRMVSFFHSHPSEIPQNEWNTFKIKKNIFIVDKLTYALMAECQCEFLVKEGEKKEGEKTGGNTEVELEVEPTIVAVKLSKKKSGIKGNKRKE